MNWLDRRHFLKLAASSTVALASSLPFDFSAALAQTNDDPLSFPGRVVDVRHSAAMQNPSRVNSQPVTEVVALMVDTALMALTRTGDIGDAWRQFISLDDRVLIKVDTLGSPYMATNEAVVLAIINGLRSLGIPDQNILIFDQFRDRMMRAHYRPGQTFDSISVEYAENRGYRTQNTSHDSGSSAFPVALAEANAVIDVPVIKDHHSCGLAMALANISLGMIENYQEFSGELCGPAVAHICDTSMVRDRLRLVICDGLRLMFDGGPQDNDSKILRNSIIAGTDPVAIDTVGLDLIESARLEHNLPTLEQEGRSLSWLELTAQRGLGVHDHDRIVYEEHILA